MKNSKALIAVLCALVLVFALAACAQQKGKTENVTQVVTDENGEIVTLESGEALTEELEAQIVTDANGNAVTEVVTDKNGTPLTTVQNNKYVNVTQVVTKPQGGKASSTAKTTSTTKKGTTAKATTTKAKTTTTTTTKPSTTQNAKERKIKITVKLPIDGDVTDELTIKINGKEIKKLDVKLDGSEYSFTTKDKYKGEVEVYASLKDHGSDSVKTDKEQCTLDIPLTRIPILVDDED